MRLIALSALLMLSCATPYTTVTPKTKIGPMAAKRTDPPAATASAPKITLPDGWRRRYVPRKFRQGDMVLLASFVKPEANARLFIWGEPDGMTPEAMADSLIVITERDRGHARRTPVPAPDAAVVYYDGMSQRGGYVIFRKASDGRVVTFDADFPPEKGEEIIIDVTEIAKNAF